MHDELYVHKSIGAAFPHHRWQWLTGCSYELEYKNKYTAKYGVSLFVRTTARWDKDRIIEFIRKRLRSYGFMNIRIGGLQKDKSCYYEAYHVDVSCNMPTFADKGTDRLNEKKRIRLKRDIQNLKERKKDISKRLKVKQEELATMS